MDGVTFKSYTGIGRLQPALCLASKVVAQAGLFLDVLSLVFSRCGDRVEDAPRDLWLRKPQLFTALFLTEEFTSPWCEQIAQRMAGLQRGYEEIGGSAVTHSALQKAVVTQAC